MEPEITLKVAHCTSCGAPIWWLRHERTKKPAPINTQPTPDGNILLDVAAACYRLVLKGATVNAGIRRYSNHFQTCPSAKQHSTRRR